MASWKPERNEESKVDSVSTESHDSEQAGGCFIQTANLQKISLINKKYVKYFNTTL
jgi:hypothetical protein